ncbi:MAG: 16S rRNA (cytidine(1402)-2'-O)-methyltransferase [Bacteroidales bacterium]|jgi:16S rRNA (cytidine1402-2'-O)-methyltransferase|nr:16S rRNA (cytidine(1402)-2'-O)-methyltransferase [Bacteroidales bacterium]
MSKLYLVPTPIGNLEDITLRAIRILKEVDLILAEDTRTSKKLLNHYQITTPLESYHLFNEHEKVERIAEKISAGYKVALISDAGTPAISDPGYLLVRQCVKHDIVVETLPGATALIVALVNSAIPCNSFSFEGFLPTKKGRKTLLDKLKTEERTMIFYESPFRLIKTLKDFSEYFGKDRRASVSRELTKLFEENKRGTLEELINYFENKTIKGEIVIIVQGSATDF